MKIRNYLLGTISQAVLVIAALMLFVSLKTHAQIKPSLLFSKGAVLQRNVAIPVWGTAEAGSEISVTINEQSNSALTDENGNWEVVLDAMEAGGPFEMSISSSSDTKVLSDIYIGDVWLASGQSNMEMSVNSADGAAAAKADLNNQQIREFKIPKSINYEVKDKLPSGSNWKGATSSTVGNFSAVGYYFAQSLQAAINVPIGIINNSYGGTRIEAYMSEEMLGFDEEIVLAGGTYKERQPTLCFNGMIHPITRFPVKGFIWYQGESNADNMEDAREYGALFKTMIKGWRELWGMGNLPFLWVQLPNQGEVSNNAGSWDAWPQLRACQSRALSLPKTGEVITIDVGEVDIHPTNKKPVGERMALVARKVAYNEDIVDQGPRYKSHTTNGNKVILSFDTQGSELISKNSSNVFLNGFALAGPNHTMLWANAKIEGNTVEVWNAAISDPTLVSYAWQYNPQNLNFYNDVDLPAAPFKINVAAPGFGIKSFTSTSTTIERGQFAVLNWEVFGASELFLNNEAVDSISGRRVIPKITTTYQLKAISQKDASVIDSTEITIEVVDPKPTISIRTDVGGIADPETEINIIATATPPKDGSITKVEFFIDAELIATLNEAPFEIKWTTPAEIGEYEIRAEVTDNQGYSVTSAPVIVYVTKMKMLIYEAEDAWFTGTGSIKSNSQASANKYVDLQSGWVLTFDNVEVAEAGTYPLTIRYLLNYESPKAQLFIVNDKNLGEITFTAPDASTWMSYNMDVELAAGINKIEFDDSWGWMSFDYIAIAVEDTTTLSGKKLGDNQLKIEGNPNPFQTKTILKYTLNKTRNVQVEVYNNLGQKINSLVNEWKEAGSHSVEFDGTKLKAGIYLTKIIADSEIVTQKLLLIR